MAEGEDGWRIEMTERELARARAATGPPDGDEERSEPPAPDVAERIAPWQNSCVCGGRLQSHGLHQIRTAGSSGLEQGFLPLKMFVCEDCRQVVFRAP